MADPTHYTTGDWPLQISCDSLATMLFPSVETRRGQMSVSSTASPDHSFPRGDAREQARLMLLLA